VTWLHHSTARTSSDVQLGLNREEGREGVQGEGGASSLLLVAAAQIFRDCQHATAANLHGPVAGNSADARTAWTPAETFGTAAGMPLRASREA